MTLDAVMTYGCLAVVDALRASSRHQCMRDLVEEFLCVKVIPLRVNQSWFDVKDDVMY